MATLKPRRFIAGDIDFVESAKDLSHSVTIGLYFLFLIIAIISFIVCIVSKRKKMGRGLPLAFLLIFLMLALMPMISSILSGGTLEWGILGAVAIFAATYFLPVPQISWWVREVRTMLLIVYIYGSIAAALFCPEWAWDEKYGFESALAIFPFRLFGTANHANVLAPLVIFAWLMGRFPKCRLRGEILHGCACLVVLLLTQSKSSVFIGIILFGLYLIFKMASWGTVKKYYAYSSMGLTVFFTVFYVVNYTHYAYQIEELVYDPQVLTLTGRLPLWFFSVDMWLEHPWIGQGIDAWSSKTVLDYLKVLGWAAPHAHNQVLQILSQSGLFGLTVFVALIYVSLKMLHPVAVEWRIPLYWLCSYYILNGVTEVVLQYKIGVGNTLLTWIVFTVILIVGQKFQLHNRQQNKL